MNAPRTEWSDWIWDPAKKQYYRQRWDPALNKWVCADQTGAIITGPDVAGNNPYQNSSPAAAYPPARYGGNQGQAYTVDAVAADFEGQTLHDDEDARNPIPITRPTTSSDPIFKVVLPKDQRRFFRKGKVIKLEWVQPRGQPFGAVRTPSSTPSSTTSIAEIRRFVIISRNDNHSLCLPIQTYGGRATLHPAAKSVNHVMVYSSDRPPDELPGEKLTKKPIRVEPRHGGEALVAASRLDLAKIYTVEHNIPVAPVGDVDKRDLPRLERYFREIHKDLFRVEADDDSPEDDEGGEEDDDGDEDGEDDEEDEEEKEEEGGRGGPSRGDERGGHGGAPRGSKAAAPGPNPERRRRTDESLRPGTGRRK